MRTDKTLEEQVFEKLDSLWREFYFYGWCDSDEDREEFDGMKDKIKELIRETINSVTRSIDIIPKVYACSTSQGIYNITMANNQPCAICGAKWGEQHCLALHADYDERQRNPNYNGVLSIYCNCPRCSPRC